ncbi:PepSY-associated TM helix domain-containing protein [Spirosoma foliorum]|uniref:PepSY domain-containing protein n=1 Tax=Spirosoma foliorum TaxID=2710596 RepID=A0A7G5GWQ6_9BACT|nr:PepSY-associated TM helix domain-containing protein [Spirosoma foliorum]QMW03298.1 PepSY domain-containing protein [Spirosoma foliorum]
MKLNGLGNRAYNIMFHTHTVSGIVISVALYIIFFAGAFTLFKDEFYQWENPSARIPVVKSIDYQSVIQQIKRLYPNFEETKEIRFSPPNEEEPLLSVFGTLAKPKGKSEFVGLLYNPVSRKIQRNYPYITTTGETLYRLHFLDQLPYAGRWIAGFVALFFLFASVTGVLIHWRNIVTKFYGFSLKGARKQFWTNAHTVFGLIGLPFQLMYAVTGAFYLLTLLILIPAVMVLYGGDQQKIYALIRPNEAIKLDEKAPVTTGNKSINEVLTRIEADYPGYEVSFLEIGNLNRVDALVSARITDKKSFTGDGIVSVYMKDGKKAVEVIPGHKKYVESVIDGIARVHFAQFGGLLLKGIYFILALFTCFVIISGVLLWKEARNKKNYTDKQKRFHHRVTMIYLAICLGLFPAVPLLFIAELAIPGQSVAHSSQVNTVFFLSWLLLAVAGLFMKTEARQTRFFLLSGGILSVLVPVTNGIQTNDWIWNTLNEGQQYVLGTDLYWLFTGLGALVIYGSILRNRTTAQTEKSLQAEDQVSIG